MTHQPPAATGSGANRVIRIVLTAIPLIICNLVAFTGQLSFIRDHMHWPLIGDIGFAAGLESIAIFLAAMAHDALMAEDSSFKLRMGSYGVALVAAGLNYSHYAVHFRPTFAAVGTAVMSAASPFLWGIFSRRQSRDALMAAGLIERHSVRLGSARWLWHPIKSARVMWHATWTGETRIQEAIAAIEPRPLADDDPEPPEPASGQLADEHTVILAHADNDAARIRYAAQILATDRPAHVRRWLINRGYRVNDSNVRSVLRRVRDARAIEAPARSAAERGQ